MTVEIVPKIMVRRTSKMLLTGRQAREMLPKTVTTNVTKDRGG